MAPPGLLLAAAVVPDREPAGTVLLVGGLALALGSLFVGPAAGFVVTPLHLHIDTGFRRISVPRRLLGTFEHSQLDPPGPTRHPAGSPTGCGTACWPSPP